MDLASPISSVIPTAQGAVLEVLARTGQPLSGREVAELTRGRVGQWRVNQVLGELADAGIVLKESRPPANYYLLNHDHLASDGIKALTGLRAALITRIAGKISNEWSSQPSAVWLFGSAARGDGGVDSDIDLLVVGEEGRKRGGGSAHQADVDELSSAISTWTGNDCQIVYLTRWDLDEMVKRGERLIDEIVSDAIVVSGKSPSELIRRPRTREAV